ncbi:MAG: peptidylprolyl isomerase [Patescibacteria group bacterium]
MRYVGIISVVVIVVVLGAIAYILLPYGDVAQHRLSSPAPTDNTLPFPPGAQLEMADIDPIDTDVAVTLKTTQGDIQLLLHGTDAPITVGNFVKLAEEDFYDSTVFHRVIPDFMIQGGDPEGNGTGGPGYEFGDEINSRKIVRGSVAMANSGPSTNGSQFFIVTAATTLHLDGRHTNFGEVTSGMDIVDAISKLPTGANDKPLESVTITDVVVHNVSKVTPEAAALKIE